MSSNGYINGQPDVSWWLQQVNAGIAYRRKFAKEPRWKTWRAYYRGDWSSDIMPVATFFKMIRTIVPRVYFRNPSVSIQPGKPGVENWSYAQLQERIDNKMIKKMRVKRQIKRLVQDTFLFGTGIGKLGFGAQFTPTPNQLGYGTEDPTTRNHQRVEYHSRVQPNMPWFAKTPTGNFIVPAGAATLDESRWCAEWFRRPLEDVKDDPRMKNTAQLVSTSRSSATGNPISWSTPDTMHPVEMIDLVEIRDKKTGKVFIIAPFSTERILLFADDGMQVSGRLPFYDVIFNEDDEVFWGVPDSVVLEPNALEANEIRTQIMRHRRMALVKILAARGVLKEEEANKMVSENVCPVVNIDGDPMTDIRIMEGIDIPDALFKAENINAQDTREAMGFSRNEFGETSPQSARTSAAETRVVKAASEIRVDERRDMIAEMMVDMVQDMHTVTHNEWQEEQVIDVAGPAGMRLWVEFNPMMLRSGVYEVSIDPDTSLPQTKDMREQKAMAMYMELKKNPLIDPMKLTRYLMHEMHGVEFDDMMVMPNGANGTQEKPLSMGQFIGMNQAVSNKTGKRPNLRAVS